MSDKDQLWYRLEVLVEANCAARAASVIWEFDALGVEVQDRQTYADDDAVPAVPDGTERLIAFFGLQSPPQAALLERDLLNALADADLAAPLVQFGRYTDDSWETGWREFFEPAMISPRVVVGPPWEEFDAPTPGTKLVIEPGLAFGTGTHETTHLCATHLDRLLAEAPSKPSVADIGCGSGILAMIARRLGAGRIEAVDIDQTAVDVARDNLQVNDLIGSMSLSTTPVDQLDGAFDIVVANILTHVLVDLSDDLRRLVAPGGSLLLGGIADGQLDDVQRAFEDPMFSEVLVDRDGQWVCCQLRRGDP